MPEEKELTITELTEIVRALYTKVQRMGATVSLLSLMVSMLVKPDDDSKQKDDDSEKVDEDV